MDFTYYLSEYKKAAKDIDKTILADKEMKVNVGIVLNSVALKLQKKTWTNGAHKMFQPGPSIFFSVWTNDQSIAEEKLLYNIHAFKLRQLQGYSIASREFAFTFRDKFAAFKNDWPNVSVDFGPLTLMEGWIKADPVSVHRDVLRLANTFLKIDHLVDEVLGTYKK
jgi:hypothetical protein